MNDIRDITNQLKNVGSSNLAIAKQIESVSGNLAQVTKAMRRTNAIENASLLTIDVIKALRDIANAGSDANNHSQQRIQENPSLRGTYLALADAGFLDVVEDIGQDVFVLGITNRGLWAIEHRETLDKENKAEKRRETFKFALGVAVELIAVLLAWWLGVNGPSLISVP